MASATLFRQLRDAGACRTRSQLGGTSPYVEFSRKTSRSTILSIIAAECWIAGIAAFVEVMRGECDWGDDAANVVAKARYQLLKLIYSIFR